MFRFFPSSVFAGLINISDELLMLDMVTLLCSAANSDSWIITGPTFSNGMEINTQQLFKKKTNLFVLFVNNRRLNVATEWACYHSVPSSLCQYDVINKACMSGMKYVTGRPFFLLFIEKSKPTRLCPGEHKFEARKKEKEKHFFCSNIVRTSKQLNTYRL